MVECVWPLQTTGEWLICPTCLHELDLDLSTLGIHVQKPSVESGNSHLKSDIELGLRRAFFIFGITEYASQTRERSK